MITESWETIIEWGNRNAPEMLEDLNTGASEEQIAALEAELGQPIPSEFRESLLIHNGESDGWPCKVFANYGAYLGTESILENWKQRKEIAAEVGNYEDQMPDQEQQIRDGIIFVEGPVRPKLFLPEWIPIMDCNSDVFWALDMNPVEGGISGQIIAVDWEGCSWMVIADSFGSFIRNYAQELEDRAYRAVDGQPTKEEDE